MMDPECELSERERRQDPTPFDWGADVLFLGESLPVAYVSTLNAAAIDAENMTYAQWRENWQCAENGDLVTA